MTHVLWMIPCGWWWFMGCHVVEVMSLRCDSDLFKKKSCWTDLNTPLPKYKSSSSLFLFCEFALTDRVPKLHLNTPLRSVAKRSGRVLQVDRSTMVFYLTGCSFGSSPSPFSTPLHSPSSAQLYLEPSQAEPLRPFRTQPRAGGRWQGWVDHHLPFDLLVRNSLVIRNNVWHDLVAFLGEKLAAVTPGLREGERQGLEVQ